MRIAAAVVKVARQGSSDNNSDKVTYAINTSLVQGFYFPQRPLHPFDVGVGLLCSAVLVVAMQPGVSERQKQRVSICY
jgi:hypothetical protein